MNIFKHALLVMAIGAATVMPSMGQGGGMGGMGMRGGGPRLSPHDDAYTRIGGRLVTIYYGRPYLKKQGTETVRTAWGGELAPWDKPYRLGADEATTLVNQVPIIIGGTTLPVGVYTLYMVPSESGPSKLAISKATGKWGIPVDVTHDIARVDLKKDDLPNTVDQLTISFSAGTAPNTTVLKIAWEKTQYSVEIANAPAGT